MSFTLEDVQDAYIRLKSYIYYDNTDILLRRKLVEFETNRTKDDIFSILNGGAPPYRTIGGLFRSTIKASVEEKLEAITNALNNFHDDPSFFNYFLEIIDVYLYPKTIVEPVDENFITNQRVRKTYKVSRITAFINAPIELHIISVLWIIKHGISYDAKLSNSCLGNRLLLNKNKDKLVQGSGLFKPYYTQYQKWRDDSVSTAQQILKNEKNALFINLDIRDYFHSVRFTKDELFEGRKRSAPALNSWYNLKELFWKIHERYTSLIVSKYKVPYNFENKIKRNKNGELKETILPIGLLSSYVLANKYLESFDDAIEREIKPAYYGRYVDDILIVISESHYDSSAEDSSLSNEAINGDENEIKTEEESKSIKLTILEKYIQKNFNLIFQILPSPDFLIGKDEKDKNGKVLKLIGYDYLYCQSKKTLAYFFDHKESDLVIDKLKKELNERTSEFRDFPEEDENEETFENSAYHLQYDNSDAKIRTLKDYKEDRYGLTVYLSNKIFSALRHKTELSDKEINEVLKFFKGSSCLNFYRLWERIFTYFLVNKNAKAYVEFYLHCLEQIDKIKCAFDEKETHKQNIINTLIEYLDCAHEISLSLNPKFIKQTQSAFTHFEFQMNKAIANMPMPFSLGFEPTRADSFWVIRFRQTNMLRQHYVVHPLLSYTVESKTKDFDLTSLTLDFSKYTLDTELIENSPRPVKFWECTSATLFIRFKGFDKSKAKINDGYLLTDILGDVRKAENETDETLFTDNVDNEFYLESAFKLYQKINENHVPNYVLYGNNFRDQFYTITPDTLKFDGLKEVKVQEVKTNSNAKLSHPNISFANTAVEEKSIIDSIRGTPNLSRERYKKISKILKAARKEKSDFLLFPEFFIPINLLSSLIRYSEKNQVLTVVGLEHVNVKSIAFNFVVTILPIEVNGIKDAVVVYRLKNHYAPVEELLIEGNHAIVPKPIPYRYDIFRWRNVYFSTYYCFELANSMHRSVMKGKLDLLIGVEWNKDTNYYSNIVEATTRDLHLYMAQVNTSQYGDTRLTQPVESARKDILRLKGGINDAILVAKLDIPVLREFQRKKFSLTNSTKEYKPLPPDYPVNDVLKRINNQSVL